MAQKKVEDVLLQIPQVRYKKSDGTLFIMKERVVFILENRDEIAVSHSFYDIKMQKISPEGKPKIQLQLVLQNGNSTFHFVNKNGTQHQMRDRERVKELIQSILPNFKRKIDTELEQKNKLLTENPKLLQLYKDLVISKVLTSEEFWQIHGKDLQNIQNASSKQEIGVSGNFLTEIKPINDGCNQFKLNLTPEVIESVFRAYPAVKKKHAENVPTKLSESEFWTKFFQSHYFHRDRITTGMKDLFSECGKMDESMLRKDIRRSNDPLLNLSKFGDNTIEEGFCSSSGTEVKTDSAGNIVHQNIIKRFNQHSFMILKTCKDQKSAEPNAVEEQKAVEGSNKRQKKDESEVVVNSVNVPTEEERIEQTQQKRMRIAEKIQYEDLGNGPLEQNKDDALKTTSINLDKLERYLYGPMPSSSDNSFMANNKYKAPVDVTDMAIRKSTLEWGQRVTHKQLINPTAAVNALGELSPGGILMSGYHDHNLSQFVPPEVEKELNNLYLSAGELLKEFWLCFPPITPELEAKVLKMHDTIQRFNSSKIKPFEDRIIRDLSPLGSQLLAHLNLLIETSFRKFSSWKEKKGSKTK